MEKPSSNTVLPVAETAADALNLTTNELPHLNNTIDTDALAAVLSQPGVTVAFQYAGLDLVVHSGGTVYARPIAENWNEPRAWTTDNGV